MDASLSLHFDHGSDYWKGTDAILSVVNLADRNPPFLVNPFFPINFDGSNASALGRFISLQISAKY